jgi:spore photoproduct lyase
MYPSAHYLLFVNFDHFKAEIKKTSKSLDDECWFFSGYDCDSLALESVTGFASDFLPFFRELPNAWIELRTKSVAIQSLQKIDPLERAVVAFSFTPQEISTQLEKGVPSVDSRIKAITQLAALGWKVGLRIDPLIDCKNFAVRYENLFNQIFKYLPTNALHSVSFGAFRMPAGFFKKIEKQYPEEPLFAGNFKTQKGQSSYPPETEIQLKEFCIDQLLKYIDASKIFSCDVL